MSTSVCTVVNFWILSSGFSNVIQDFKGHHCKSTFSHIFAEFQLAALSPLCFSPARQLTVEKLCRLKALHSGLSPAVLRDLQWPEISEAAHCQCWRTLLTELKPGHRAMLYNAMQEVTVLLSVFSASLLTSLLFSSLLIVFCDSPCCHVLTSLTQ